MENTMSRLSPTVLALSLAAALTAIPAEAAQRAFVSSSGNDANTASGCGLATPCRSFASAQTVVSDGGEIVALDAAGYGPITIVKNVTITANPGFYAGIASPSGDAVTIATSNINVILRGLNINGTGGANGVVMTDGASLAIENCVISNFTNRGVFVDAPAKVRIADSVVRGNGLDGIVFGNGATADVVSTKAVANGQVGIQALGDVASTITTVAVSDSIASGNLFGMAANSIDAAATARLTVTHSTASNNANAGIFAFTSPGPALVTVGYSMATGNGIGLQNSGATLRSLGNNIVNQNGTDTSGAITTIAGI
jgi:hypothetical protein